MALYEATDGDNWFNNENWLTDAPAGRMVRHYGTDRRWPGRGRFSCDSNGLDGEIPAEIGARLDSLRLT